MMNEVRRSLSGASVVSTLHLPSLLIANFRGIPELRLEDLGRANLLVGPNGAGKSSVLDAIRLYARPGDLDVLIDLLQERHEVEPQTNQSDSRPLQRILEGQLPLETLYPDRDPQPDKSMPILIGLTGLPFSGLSMQFTWSGPKGIAEPENESGNGLTRTYLRPNLWCAKGGGTWVFVRGPSASDHSQLAVYAAPGHGDWDRYWTAVEHVGAGGLTPARVSFLWDRLLLTPLQKDVIEAVKIVDDRVQDLAIRRLFDDSRERFPVAILNASEDAIPLRSLGDGVARAFGIGLALLNAKDGFLLLDEFENGLHYSTQTDLWRFIFELATRHNVQVFATTHSNDCVAAFQQAAEESREEGKLYRMMRGEDRIVVARFDEELLQSAVDGGLEVRG